MAWNQITTDPTPNPIPRSRIAAVLAAASIGLLVSLFPTTASAQMGGMGGGMPGGGAPGPAARPRFRDAIHEAEGLTVNREKGDKIVASVRVVGNRRISGHSIAQKLQTRRGRFYDDETVLSDISRLNEMGTFDNVSFETTETPDGVAVLFKLRERPVIGKVVFHGNRALNERELKGRSGVTAGDPLSPFAVENANRRLIDYYREEGFNRVAISSKITDDGDVVFRINEGPKERIRKIRIIGGTIVSESRLKNVIKSRDSRWGLTTYAGNVADMNKINRDVEILQQYLHNLGFLTATVGRTFEFEPDGKFMNLTFVVNEGPRYAVNEVQILNNTYMTEESIRSRLELKPGDFFDGTLMRRDIGDIMYGYGEHGFIYAEVEPKTIIRDEDGTVDLVYQIVEGDRWRIDQIHVRIDGEPQLMKESTILNLLELHEGEIIDRRKLESDQRRLGASPLLESDMNIAEPPDIKVVPKEGTLR